jgi:RNA polymerase primary sigma factor
MYIDCKTMRQVTMGNPDITNRYFKDLRQLEQLAHVNQTELMKEYAVCLDEQRRQDIKNKIVLANQAFVVSLARHLSSGDDFNDLISEGNIGLIKAIDAFNTEKENNFLTYAAHWIRKMMIEYIILSKRIVKPKNPIRVYTYSEAAKNKYFCENGWFPTEEETLSILKAKGVPLANKNDLYAISVSSIDSEFTDDNTDATDTGWFDKVCYENGYDTEDSSNIYKYIENASVNNLVNKSLSYLDDNEKTVVCQYFGIGERQQTPYEIGLRLGMKGKTPEDIKKIERKVEKLIKKYIQKIRKNGKIETNVQ